MQVIRLASCVSLVFVFLITTKVAADTIVESSTILEECKQAVFHNDTFNKGELHSYLSSGTYSAKELSEYLSGKALVKDKKVITEVVTKFTLFKFLTRIEKCQKAENSSTYTSKEKTIKEEDNLLYLKLVQQLKFSLPNLVTGTSEQNGVLSKAQVVWLTHLLESTEIALLKYWLDNDGAMAKLSYNEVLLLLDKVNYEEAKQFEVKHQAALKEERRQRKLKAGVIRQSKVAEFNLLTEQLIRTRSLDEKQQQRFDELKQELEDKNTYLGIDLPLTSFDTYPNPTTRFFYGAEVITSKLDDFKFNPNVGIFYYRHGEKWSFSNTLGITSISQEFVNELDEVEDKENEKSTTYNIYVDQLAYFTRPRWHSDVKDDVKLYRGLVAGAALNIYQVQNDEGEKFVYRPDLIFGYRASYSPERYTEYTLRRCIDIADNLDFKCHLRLRAESKFVTQTLFADTKVQIGVSFELKTDDEDVLGNSVALNFRFHSSFSDIYKRLLPGSN